jgi:hypothetical protein
LTATGNVFPSGDVGVEDGAVGIEAVGIEAVSPRHAGKGAGGDGGGGSERGEVYRRLQVGHGQVGHGQARRAVLEAALPTRDRRGVDEQRHRRRRVRHVTAGRAAWEGPSGQPGPSL